MIEGYSKTFQKVQPRFGFLQLKATAANDDCASVLDEVLKYPLYAKHSWNAVPL